jgi:hypothetical protein
MALTTEHENGKSLIFHADALYFRERVLRQARRA